MKIAIVICYMGKLPWYFDYFVHSCKYNPTIDFFIISDDTTCKIRLPRNVIIIYKTIMDLNVMATMRFGFAVDIKRAYKLCDFKPTYGFLFSDLLGKYDFWGHGDIDVIFGNIRNFISSEVLSQNDLISVRHDFLTGYFLLFRNCDKMNILFTKSKDYKRVLQSDIYLGFDETSFQFNSFAEGKAFDTIPSEVESMMHVAKRMEQEGHIRAFFDFLVVEGVPGSLKWIKGSLFFRRKYEILLYHMIHFKKKYSPKRRLRKMPETFNISKNRIYSSSVN
ncbi:MAG TPA: DUF6625 family protein [Chryseolinea sp.]|nr:DUF6625 family protein [Chryseolinea sp.]